jgi:hypothetical protein
MKALITFLFLLSSVLHAADRSTPIVVELFTSEGCSSCPPADAFLAQLERQPISGAEVIPLGLHVDYWNYIGWKDRFSSPLMTARQQRYATALHLDSAYTPQLVIDGQSEFVGSDTQKIREAIQHSAATPKPIAVELSLSPNNALSVRIPGTSAKSAEVLLAITETNLTTSVGAGENHGRTLNHAAVVRELRSLGTLSSAGFSSSVPLNLGRDWHRENTKAIIFVQESASRHILGAASISLK